MNLRDIKKDIEYVIGAFIEDCSLFASLHSDSSAESVDSLLGKAVNLYNDLRDKVNSKTEKRNAAYFTAIRKELLEKTDALYEELSSLVKAAGEVKPA